MSNPPPRHAAASPRATSTTTRSSCSRAWFERAARGGAAGRGGLPGHRRRRRHARRAHGPAQGLRRARVPLLHQRGLGQGRPARGEPARRPGLLLARARPPGPGPRPGRAARRERVRRVLREPRPREPDRRLGEPAEPPARRPRGARRRGRRGRGAVRRRPRCRGRRTGAATGVVPVAIEFWQGQVGRLHDRFRYRAPRATALVAGPGWRPRPSRRSAGRGGVPGGPQRGAEEDVALGDVDPRQRRRRASP